jgi:hypothetical protein
MRKNFEQAPTVEQAHKHNKKNMSDVTDIGAEEGNHNIG